MRFKARRTFGKSRYVDSKIEFERLPSGKLDAKETFILDPNIPPRPDWMVCDCCLNHVDRLWVWRHRGWCMSAKAGWRRLSFAEGWWGFCVYCRPLFEAREIAVLVARVEALNPECSGIRETYECLAACVYGECRTWEAGQPWTRRFEDLPLRSKERPA